jgi:ribosome-binding factor A
LTLVLPGLAADEDFSSLDVVRVEPAPDASRLRVRLQSFDEGVDRERVLARLAAARGRLRAELAAHLVRRRVPDLVFAFDDAGSVT